MFAFACRPRVAGLFVLLGLTFLNGEGNAVSLSMPVSGATNAPAGYADFCHNFPTECVVRGSDTAEALNGRAWRDLQEVNTLVNRIIIPATDLEIYHRDEVWTLPKTYGDCEDYALLKRKLLEQHGWPTGDLLITVVFDEVGDGHAVLLARTSGGDFILDNKTDSIRHWYETAYRYVKRQSTEDPNRWVSIGDPRWTTPHTATSR
jgi:predicted transglutaminase-like cysteine proteinase